MKTKEILIQEFNEIRTSQKQITDFNSVSEWLEYGKQTAIKKAELLKQMENLFKN